MADDSGAPVSYLGTVEDSSRIKSQLQFGRRLMMVGRGWIGLEVAAAARGAGVHVSILEALDLPLGGVLGPEVASIFAALHTVTRRRPSGQKVVSSIEGDEGVAVVNLADGPRSRPTRSWSVGAVPEATLGEAAGLRTDNGILVDEHLRTSDPTSSRPATWRTHTTLCSAAIARGHWDDAIQQGVVAAQNMLGRVPRPSTGCPASTPTSTSSAWSTSEMWDPTATTR